MNMKWWYIIYPAITFFGISFLLNQTVFAEPKLPECAISRVESDGCAPISDLINSKDCALPKAIRCYFVPIIDVKATDSEIREALPQREYVTLRGITDKNDSLVSEYIEFLRSHPEIEVVRINLFDHGQRIKEVNHRLVLLKDRFIESGIETRRIKIGKYIRSKKSYVQIDIIRIRHEDGR